ncbi:PREDICTED: uncharacterized protein LOC109173786 [Ipomoea nil]|uniref:uncharacterized protein LOC109173786 n=1 Tax=Ipomoea nil TaxID=35883 RepID=UPI0009018460|nr:PREDICTED: uncharacterized protein LOC109173786 [Ipomoea nil]XP_019178634.1 PREDICTED: uncharacterized protein LOC109173786 [Ipomoea nil]
MGLDEPFEDATPRATRPKVKLGGKKVTSTSATTSVPFELPLAHVVQPSAVVDLNLARAPTKRGKDKALEGNDDSRPKKQKILSSPNHTPIVDALLSGLEPASLLERICAALPAPEDTSGWLTNQVGEQGARDLIQLCRTLASLFCRAKDVEKARQRDSEVMISAIDRRDSMINDLKGKVAELENKVVEFDRKVVELEGKSETDVVDYKASSTFLNDAVAAPGLLTTRIFGERDLAEPFFRSLVSTHIGKEMVRAYGKWAFVCGKRKMHNDVTEVLTQALDDNDLATILGVLPNKVADPDPAPYTEPTTVALASELLEIEMEKNPPREE